MGICVVFRNERRRRRWATVLLSPLLSGELHGRLNRTKRRRLGFDCSAEALSSSHPANLGEMQVGEGGNFYAAKKSRRGTMAERKIARARGEL